MTDSNPPEILPACDFDVCKLGVSSHRTECSSSLSAALPLTWKRRSHYGNDTQRSLCLAFASSLLMAHQVDFTMWISSTELIVFVALLSCVCVCVCVCVLQLHDNSDHHVECRLFFKWFTCRSCSLLEASHTRCKACSLLVNAANTCAPC